MSYDSAYNEAREAQREQGRAPAKEITNRQRKKLALVRRDGSPRCILTRLANGQKAIVRTSPRSRKLRQLDFVY